MIKDNRHTIGPGLDAPELVKELCLGRAFQLLDQASTVGRNLKRRVVGNVKKSADRNLDH